MQPGGSSAGSMQRSQRAGTPSGSCRRSSQNRTAQPWLACSLRNRLEFVRSPNRIWAWLHILGLETVHRTLHAACPMLRAAGTTIYPNLRHTSASINAQPDFHQHSQGCDATSLPFHREAYSLFVFVHMSGVRLNGQSMPGVGPILTCSWTFLATAILSRKGRHPVAPQQG